MRDAINIFVVSCGVLGALMIFPAAIAIVGNEARIADAFLLPSGMTIFLAGGLIIALKRGSRATKANLPSILRIAVIFILWLILPLIGALPFIFSGTQNIINGYFEAVSGITNTGGTVYLNLDGLSKALLLWRALLQWFGAILTLTGMIVVFAPLAAGGLDRQYTTYFDLHEKSFFEAFIYCASTIALMITGLTLIATFCLLIAGVNFFNATCLAITAVTTGGFLPYDQPLSDHIAPGAAIIMAIFMTISALSVFFFISLGRTFFIGRWSFFVKVYRENLIFLTVTFIVAVVYIPLFAFSDNSAFTTLSNVLIGALFSAVSILSTSGIDFFAGGINHLPEEVIIVLIFVGGAAFSLAGGIKWFRIIIMLGLIKREFARLLYPNIIFTPSETSAKTTINRQRAIASLFCVSLGIIAICAMLVVDSTSSVNSAFIVSFAAFTSTGPLYDGYADLSIIAKIALMLTMILGRIEFMALIALFSRIYWR